MNHPFTTINARITEHRAPRRHRRCHTVALLAAVVSAALLDPMKASGGITLITLPARQRLEVQLDRPGMTLVEEERTVPLAQGVNDVVFTWANVTIDRASIQLRCLTDPEHIRVLSVSEPPGQNMLTWQVSSPAAGAARVRISYLVAGLDTSYAYRAVASTDEKTCSIWQYLNLHNRANEAFGEAGMWPGFGDRLERPIGINETKQLLAARFDNVPVRKIYTADVAAYGYLDQGKRQLNVPMQYALVNDPANGLGRFALRGGKVRMFQQDGSGGEAFLGEDWVGLTPLQEDIRLHLGLAKDVVVIRTIDRREVTPVLGPLNNIDIVVKYEIENFKDAAVTLDLSEHLAALRAEILGSQAQRAVEWALLPDGTLTKPDTAEADADRVLFHVELPPRAEDQKAVKVTHTLHIQIRNEW